MAKLTSEARKKIPSQDFALPGGRYPIEDASHARNALSRVSQNGSPDEKAKVRSAVHSKYPDIGHARGAANIPGRGMPKPKPMPPMIPQAPMGMAPQVTQPPPHYATGTPDIKPIPAPGQTQTSGSWTGPTGPATPPPTGTGGQNGDLRQRLGMVGVKRFATGTQDVPLPQQEDQTFGKRRPWQASPPAETPDQTRRIDQTHDEMKKVLGLNQGTEDVQANPTQGQGGYDPQTGSYPLDDHFVAHLRAALGMQPKVQHHEQGDANVTPSFAGLNTGAPAPQQGPPAPPAPPPPATHPVGRAAGAQGAHGPSIMDSFASAIQGANQFPHGAAGPQSPMARAPAPAAQGVQGILAGINSAPAKQTPAQGPSFAGPSGGFGGGSPTQQPQSIPIDDPNKVAHVQNVMADWQDLNGVPVAQQHAAAHAMMEPYNHTEDQFAAAVKGLPIRVVEKLWAMHHYLTPQQQSGKDYIDTLHQNVDEAKNRYNQGVEGNQNPSLLTKLLGDVNTQYGRLQEIGRLNAVPGAAVPFTQGYQQ